MVKQLDSCDVTISESWALVLQRTAQKVLPNNFSSLRFLREAKMAAVERSVVRVPGRALKYSRPI